MRLLLRTRELTREYQKEVDASIHDIVSPADRGKSNWSDFGN